MEETIHFPRGSIAVPKTPLSDPKKRRRRTEPAAKGDDVLFGKETPQAKRVKDSTSKHRQKERGTHDDDLPRAATASLSSKSLVPLGGGGCTVHKKSGALTIEPLRFALLVPGLKVLAICRNVYPDLALFSLPHRWTAYLLRAASETVPLTHCLAVGDAVPVVLRHVDTQSRRIEVSCWPAHTNPAVLWPFPDDTVDIVPHFGIPCCGRVQSEQDHGVLVDLGRGRRGFLPYGTTDGTTAKEEGSMAPHRLVACVVTGPPRSQIYPLQPAHDDVAVLNLRQYTPPLADLLPGTLLRQVRVEQTASNGGGLAVSFGPGGILRGAIEKEHLDPDDDVEQLRTCDARILAVDPRTQLVRLTRLPHLLKPSSFAAARPKFPPVGTVVADCRVVHVEPGVGVTLALPETGAPVHVSIAKAVDAVVGSKKDTGQGSTHMETAAFLKLFAPATRHVVRILSTEEHWVEGMATGATAPSYLTAHVLTHADLVPGQVYPQVPVLSLLPDRHGQRSSLLVDFGLGVHGLVPALHMDASSAAAKYAVGAKVDVRVLSVAAKKCLATAKKALVKAPRDQFITSYDDVTMGQTAVGFISKMDDSGLYVTFGNGVFGRVTARSLAIELGVENHWDNYQRGNVVTCRVANIKKRSATKHRSSWLENEEDDEDVLESPPRYFYELTLSLRLDGPDTVSEEGSTSTHNRSKVYLSAGTVLPLKSLRVVKLVPGREKGPTRYVPGYAIVSIKSKYIAPEAEAATLPPFIECKLPYDQLLDHYNRKDIEDVQALDNLAENMLTVGKKINRRAVVLSDPKKSSFEYSSGTGQLAVVTIRAHFVESMERSSSSPTEAPNDGEDGVFLPGPNSHFFVGALVMGYVSSADERHGAFVRFLDGMTGLVPKTKNGLRLQLYSTVVVKVLSVDDKFSPPKVLLGLTTHRQGRAEVGDDDEEVKAKKRNLDQPPLKSGDIIEEAVITMLDFHRLYLSIMDETRSNEKIKAQMHCTMVKPTKSGKSNALPHGPLEQIITPCHPFSKWNVGDILRKLRVLSVTLHGETWVLEVTDRVEAVIDSTWYLEKAEQLNAGDVVSGIVTGIASYKGLWVELSPTLSALIPALELSTEPNVLNNLESHFHIGSRVNCVVMDKSVREANRRKYCKPSKKKAENSKAELLFLSLIGYEEKHRLVSKPICGDLVVGRIDRSLPSTSAPELLLEFRGGFIGRCCITELADADDWSNFPLGRPRDKSLNVIPPSQESIDMIDEAHDDSKKAKESFPNVNSSFAHGMFVHCRVLPYSPTKPIVEVSIRPSRLEGDLDEDEVPDTGDIIQAFVVETSKKGCFLRLSRQVEGRTILKELCDGFLPDPTASFPIGRLVVGKVKAVHEAKQVVRGIQTTVDVDMRESILGDEGDHKVQFNEVEIGGKYKGTVMRIEDYGVFVRLENSDVSGLAHKSECSDDYIKKLTDLYDPGDMVKVVVLKKNIEKRQVGFGMKASYFKDDKDSDDEESSSDEGAMNEVDDDSLMQDDEEIASDDENYVSKLSAKIGAVDGDDESENSEDTDDSEDESDDSSEGSQSSDDKDSTKKQNDDQVHSLDTNVGFDWNGGLANTEESNQVSDDDSGSSDEDEDDDNAIKSSHKSRRKQAQRRKEEQEISRRETALADGTADENPETAADFERLLAGNPNSSELWIRYMAFHLTMADIPAARAVANRAFDRIEFRQETEKLNVWCALLTLELKYGTDASLQSTLDRACQHNNPKHVYLRLCEMMVKHQEGANASSQGRSKTDATFVKMCSKFRSKKTVWIAQLSYLLEQGRHEEAQNVMQRALLSLPTHKHVETLSRYATLAFAHGRPGTARTVFHGMLLKYPKRLDLLFVYADQEIKHGHISSARSLFQRVAKNSSGGTVGDSANMPMKLNDKQMKRFFKKWFTFEEAHGTETTQESVKDAARAYIAQSK